ncbi:MAG TPA: hypothetical protein VH413_12845 [Verrucomicrobiae bacterium]|jgi:hypothetical protein|nr:hypothetical protein [Verrucomicrobiae bacterium]
MPMIFSLKLGDGTVDAVVHQNKGPLPTMINVHDDEDVSVAAGKANIAEFGGRVIELVHSGERLITFSLGGQTFSFDPNRIFSDAGIAATLTKHSVNAPEAAAAIKAFAAEYLRVLALEKEPVIIALHNTIDGTFSVESFGPNGLLKSEAALTHISSSRDKFDFFYVTEESYFEFLREREFNVVLQDNANVTEDGSLSVFFAKRGIPYINVEAEIKNLGMQVEMLRAVRVMIGM